MRRALVVDDVELDRGRIARMLTDAGWQVEFAHDGEQALVLARSARPHIVFMDIVMPGMDGFETCRRLTRDPSTRAIPIVMVSTKQQRADQIWARMQGARELIGKPCERTEVLEALRHAS